MTTGEKMVWAAAFALNLKVRFPPSELLLPGRREAWGAWEHEQIVQAIEAATGAVRDLRLIGPRISEGFSGSELEALYTEMLR